jgi:hypothetical protein
MDLFHREDEICNFNKMEDCYEERFEFQTKHVFDQARADCLINDLNNKWNEIERNKRKIDLKQNNSIKDFFKEPRKYTNTSVSSSTKIVFRKPNVKRVIEEEDNEFDIFVKNKNKELEKYKTGFHFENKKTDYLLIKKDKESFLTEKKEKSFIKKDNIETNIEEILIPSYIITTKMHNIYEMIAEEQEKKDEEYSLTALENDFGKLISKINPSCKNKTLFEKPSKLHRKIIPSNITPKVFEKNSFDTFQTKTRLKKILNK